MSPFSAPFSGAPRGEGFCFQGERLLYRREPNGVEGGTGKAEAAKLPDAGINLKRAQENEWRKKSGLLYSATMGMRNRTLLSATRKTD